MTSPKNAPITTFPCWYGKYELVQRLGVGGMAEVFLARLPGPEGFERMMVIKRILPALAHETRMEDSFIAEATLAAQVQHDNIVHVYELQRLDNGELFMSMEYVDGIDLAQLFRAANKRKLRIPPWFSVRCIAEVLEALAYAHELKDKHGRSRNLVHRDVTPSNIFVSKNGAVKLADFGVARDETRGSKTLRGELKGKLSYMPPEQLRRQPIDRRTDIFAVGVVLWELLAQRRLFGGTRRPDIDTMNLICSAPRVPPSNYQRDVHPDLDRSVLRALQVDPEARYQDAGGFRMQLADVLEALHPGTELSHVRDVVEMLTGERPPTVALTLDVTAQFVEPGDYTRSDSHEHSTEVASTTSAPSLSASAASRSALSRSYSGEFPFWVRTESGASIGPQNYWDMIDGLRRMDQRSEPLISIDGVRWLGLRDFASLTGQEGMFRPRRRPAKGADSDTEVNRSSLLSQLAALHAGRANGSLEIDFTSGTAEVAEVFFADGEINHIISTHAQLQSPEILMRDTVLTRAQIPAIMHQLVSDRRPLEELASADGWLDAGELRARAIRTRLAALLGESANIRFRAKEAPPLEYPVVKMLPMLPAIVHEAMPARTLRALLGPKLGMGLTPRTGFEETIAAMHLSQDEHVAVQHLIEGDRIEDLVERNPEYETFYLYLAHLLLEIGAVRST